MLNQWYAALFAALEQYFPPGKGERIASLNWHTASLGIVLLTAEVWPYLCWNRVINWQFKRVQHSGWGTGNEGYHVPLKLWGKFIQASYQLPALKWARTLQLTLSLMEKMSWDQDDHVCFSAWLLVSLLRHPLKKARVQHVAVYTIPIQCKSEPYSDRHCIST